MKWKNAYFLVIIVLILASCKKDDDPIGEVAPPRLLSEVAEEDNAEIVEFLKTHFYNYDEFMNPTDDNFNYKIRFGKIEGANGDKQSIFDSPNLVTETITVSSSTLGLDDGEVVDLKLYVLVARQGIKEGKPTIGDNVILRYEGSLLNGTLFDASTNQPVSLNLSGVVRGFGNGVEYFQTGMGPIENGDGTISYEGYGVGAIFIPSGLGYFNRSSGNIITAYSPLVFKIDAFAFEPNTDTDNDGIPSILEDVNNNGNLNDDNTDGDFSQSGAIYNYIDPDDDNDGIPTRDEINLDADGNFLSFKDTDGDGVPDHLDNDL